MYVWSWSLAFFWGWSSDNDRIILRWSNGTSEHQPVSWENSRTSTRPCSMGATWWSTNGATRNAINGWLVNNKDNDCPLKVLNHKNPDELHELHDFLAPFFSDQLRWEFQESVNPWVIASTLVETCGGSPSSNSTWLLNHGTPQINSRLGV